MLNSSLAWRTGDLSGHVKMPGNVGCYPDNVDRNPGRGFALQATHLTFHASGLRPSKKIMSCTVEGNPTGRERSAHVCRRRQYKATPAQ